jgi:hypothetical protein
MSSEQKPVSRWRSDFKSSTFPVAVIQIPCVSLKSFSSLAGKDLRGEIE